jgi:DNA-binding NarL/FixJ family response regulator
MSKTKVIIVDDHKAISAGLCLLLKDLGNEVIGQASNGIEFLKLLETLTPDIVLMDIQMPGMNGIEATKIALQKYPTLKILVLSMFDDEKYYNSMIELGVKGFILKESEHDEIEQAINAIMAGKHYFSQDLLVNLLKKKHDLKSITLKPREKEILQLLCKGLSSVEIADKLHVSSRTVEKTRSELLQKTDTTNSISLVIYAIKNKLVEL